MPVSRRPAVQRAANHIAEPFLDWHDRMNGVDVVRKGYNRIGNQIGNLYNCQQSSYADFTHRNQVHTYDEYQKVV